MSLKKFPGFPIDIYSWYAINIKRKQIEFINWEGNAAEYLEVIKVMEG